VTSAPFEPMIGTVPRTSTSLALAARDPGETMPAAAQMALRCRTAMVDLTLDGDVLYGRPRSAVGYVSRLDGPAADDGLDPARPVLEHLQPSDGQCLRSQQLRLDELLVRAVGPLGHRRVGQVPPPCCRVPYCPGEPPAGHDDSCRIPVGWVLVRVPLGSGPERNELESLGRDAIVLWQR